MDLYREEILEHWQNPSNWGEMKDANLVVNQVNPLCGDTVTFYFRLSADLQYYSSSRRREVTSKNNILVSKVSSHSVRTIIKDVSFTGNGCAISIASASILSEYIKGRPIGDLLKLKGGDVLKMIGASRDSFPPARLKCAFLALEAVKRLKS